MIDTPTGSTPWVVAFYFWLQLMLWPNAVLGMVILYYALQSDGMRDRHPYARHAARMIRRCTVALAVLGACSAYLAAAAVYNLCNDPAYINTWWWYAWGCWMY